MLAVSNISKSFGIKQILNQVSFTLKQGERAGLVGPNGCGKTTLLRILAGLDQPDSGSVRFTPALIRAGYLPQGLMLSPGETISSFLAGKSGDQGDLLAKLETLAGQLALSPGIIDLQDQYDAILNGISRQSEQLPVLEVLDRFGLSRLDGQTPVSHLSGGQKTRLALAGILLDSPQILMLDEPTNHLDIQMLEWLERWLSETSATCLIISHDRAFLDSVTSITLELDPITHTLKEYPGNYSFYLEMKQNEWDTRWQKYNDQQNEIQELTLSAAHLRGIARFRKGGKADTGDKFAAGFFANRSKATMGRAKHMEKRLEQILTEEKVEKPRPSWQLKIDFDRNLGSSRNVLTLESLTAGYGKTVLLEDLSLSLRHGERVALIGPNGSGKTTLLRTITGEIPPLAGEYQIGSGIKMGIMAQEQDTLDPRENAVEAMRKVCVWNDTETRSFLSKYLFTGDDVFTTAENMSYGERARLMLACLVASGCNFLLLDEPVNHLDIPSRVRFEQALQDFDGTILAVVHDRYFIRNFATGIWEIQGQGIKVI